MKSRIHNTSDVKSTKIGKNTTIWQFVVILENARIGNNCNINCHVFIENDVIIGDNVTIKSGVQLWNGVKISDNVFIGPNVSFTNDLFPKSKRKPEKFIETIIKNGASIGANATIICGNTIGKNSLIAAGSVVTKNVGSNELWAGNPAKKIGYITENAEILDLKLISKKTGDAFVFKNDILLKK